MTALAPSALQAEMRAKAALLAGPAQAQRWLPDGGLIVHDDGTHTVLSARSQAGGRRAFQQQQHQHQTARGPATTVAMSIAK